MTALGSWLCKPRMYCSPVTRVDLKAQAVCLPLHAFGRVQWSGVKSAAVPGAGELRRHVHHAFASTSSLIVTASSSISCCIFPIILSTKSRGTPPNSSPASKLLGTHSAEFQHLTIDQINR